MHTLLKLAQLRWTGHVTRINGKLAMKSHLFKWESAPNVARRNAIRITLKFLLRISTYIQSPENILHKIVQGGVAL